MKTDRALTWEEAVVTLRHQPESAALVEACFFDDPLLDAADRYWRSTEWLAVRHFLPAAPGTALDIGSGRGISAYALTKDGFRVTALEPDPSPVVGAEAIRRLAREADLTIDVVQTWGEDLPFAPASFDLVHCRQVLHHARDLGELCRQIARVLRPDGIFIATREHVLSRHEDLPAFLQNHPLHSLYGGENAYLLQEYLSAIEAAGMRLERVLNPLESDINLFPETRGSFKSRLATRLHLRPTFRVPDFVLTWLGKISNTPGRPYSFIARRPDA